MPQDWCISIFYQWFTSRKCDANPYIFHTGERISLFYMGRNTPQQKWKTIFLKRILHEGCMTSHYFLGTNIGISLFVIQCLVYCRNLAHSLPKWTGGKLTQHIINKGLKQLVSSSILSICRVIWENLTIAQQRQPYKNWASTDIVNMEKARTQNKQIIIINQFLGFLRHLYHRLFRDILIYSKTQEEHYAHDH